MNKIMFNGKEVLDIDSVKDKYTKSEVDALIAGDVKSTDITRIAVVTDYPQQEENGVLYIKIESQNNNSNNNS